MGLFGDGLRQIEVDGIVVTISPPGSDPRRRFGRDMPFEVPRLLCEEVGIEDIAVVPRSLVLLEVQAISGPPMRLGVTSEVVKEIPHAR